MSLNLGPVVAAARAAYGDVMGRIDDFKSDCEACKGRGYVSLGPDIGQDYCTECMCGEVVDTDALEEAAWMAAVIAAMTEIEKATKA